MPLAESTMGAKVFINHSSKGDEAAKAICAALENRTLPCWIASRNVGPFEHTQPDWAAGGN
jgi:hypothetical protein